MDRGAQARLRWTVRIAVIDVATLTLALHGARRVDLRGNDRVARPAPDGRAKRTTFADIAVIGTFLDVRCDPYLPKLGHLC